MVTQNSIIRCLGQNTENLPFNEFKQQFIKECSKEGSLVQLHGMGDKVLLGVVRR